MRAELEAAALTLLEAQLEAGYQAAMAERAGSAAGGPPALPALSIDPALHRRVLHLMDLARHIEAGRCGRLWADELLGLDAVRGARARFDAKHPECPHCSAPLAKAADTRCWRCWSRIAGKEN